LSLSSQKYGFGIRDLRSGIRKKPIPDPGVKKAPDPGSATLHSRTGSEENKTGILRIVRETHLKIAPVPPQV
jgi:hypothetical protein